VSPALWLLIRLQLGGWLRYLRRSLGTVKGALLAVVGGGVFFIWVSSALLLQTPQQSYSLDNIRRYGPAFLLGYCLLNLLRTRERVVYFTPAEVNFLFSAPLGRRQLLGYKIAYTLLLGLPSALLMSCFVRVWTPWFLAAYIALLLIFLFMQLFDMVLALLVSTVGAGLYSHGRRLLFAAVVAGAAALLWYGGAPSGEAPLAGRFVALFDTTAWQVVSWPLRCFFQVFTASGWRELLTWSAASAAVNLALVGVIFLLDWQYMEASAAASVRIYERVQRVRRGGMSSVGTPGATALRLSLPMPPGWGGIGPLLWRQLLTAQRGLGRLLLVCLVIGCFLVFPMLNTMEEAGEVLVPTLIGTIVWVTILMTSVVPFDFRGDVERIALLKTLPIASWRLVVGQLLTPVLVLTMAEWLALAGLVFFSPRSLALALACALHAPGLNFFLFGLDNLLFLLFPTRMAANSPGDFQAMGRNVLGTLARMLGLVFLGSGGVLVGLVVWLVTGGNWPAAVAAPLPLVLAADAALVPLIALVFRGFDVSRDVPS
jgi:hypothetical protein